MEYKGYRAKVEFDDQFEVFHGEVIDTRDVITFQGGSVRDLKKEFKLSIDDYLEFCESRGEAPDKPFSGKFVLRLKPDLHKRVYQKSKVENKSLNNWVSEVLESAV
jgi:predicted HicB family RNase H-like nuclease